VVSGTQSGGIELFEISTGILMHKFEGESQKWVNTVMFNPEEFQMVAGGKDKVLKFFDMENMNF